MWENIFWIGCMHFGGEILTTAAIIWMFTHMGECGGGAEAVALPWTPKRTYFLKVYPDIYTPKSSQQEV